MANATSYTKALQGARDEIAAIINREGFDIAPMFLRLAFHDAGTFNREILEWPRCGGANGSIRSKSELNGRFNGGLDNAVKWLDKVKEKFPALSFADIYQLSAHTAIWLMEGPKMTLNYGRTDAPSASLANAMADSEGPRGGGGVFPPRPAGDMRRAFKLLNFDDRDIVALCGAHTVGRSAKDRTMDRFAPPHIKGTKGTKYTVKIMPKCHKEADGISWTPNWLTFNNEYYKNLVAPEAARDPDLLLMDEARRGGGPELAIRNDPGFSRFAQQYAKDQGAFFKDYETAHKKMSELGVRWMPSFPVAFKIVS